MKWEKKGRYRKLVVIREGNEIVQQSKKLNEVTGDTREQEKQIISHQRPE